MYRQQCSVHLSKQFRHNEDQTRERNWSNSRLLYFTSLPSTLTTRRLCVPDGNMTQPMQVDTVVGVVVLVSHRVFGARLRVTAAMGEQEAQGKAALRAKGIKVVRRMRKIIVVGLRICD